MTKTKHFLMMTTAAALCAAPMLAFGQANTGGSSQMQGTTQTTPQQGTLGGMPAARGAATTGSDTGRAPNTGGIAPNAAGNPGQQATSGAEGRTTNPSGNATGEPLRTDGGRGAATGAPGASPQGNPGSSQAQMDRIRNNEGNTTGTDARPGAAGRNEPNAGAAAQGQGRTTDQTGQTPGVTGGTGGGAAGTTGSAITNQPPGGSGRTNIDNQPVGGSLGSAPANRTDGGTAAGSTAAGPSVTTGATTTGATTGTMAVDSARITDGRRASRLIGSTVYNEQNESIGQVDDIIIPQGSNQPVAVISVGGFLGIGARLVAVPYERLQHAGDRDRWTLPGATKDSLQSLPAFDYDNLGNRRG